MMKNFLDKPGLQYTLTKLKSYIADKNIRTATPVGASIVWYGPESTIPNDFMREDGRSLNKNEYPELFAIIGYTYGGSGNNFNLPDSRGKVIVHVNESETEFNTLNKIYGEKAHTLTTNEIPTHNHVSRMAIYGDNNWKSTITEKYRAVARASSPVSINNSNKNQITPGSVTYTLENVSPSNPLTEVGLFNMSETTDTGSDQPHNNIQPSLTAYRIIKVKTDVYTENLKNLDEQINLLTEQVNSLQATVDKLNNNLGDLKINIVDER